MQLDKVLVVGLGQLGLPVAEYVRKQGFEVYGSDTNIEAIERAERTTGIKKADNFSDFDVYIICISTHAPEDMFLPKIDGVLSVAERISKEAKKDGALVSIESTVPKGTSRKIFEILSHRLHVVHVPHRWYGLEEKKHGVNQLRVIGGVGECCLRAGMQFYNARVGDSNINTTDTRTATLSPGLEDNDTNYDVDNNKNKNKQKNLDIPIYPLSGVEIAEITKIVENTYRYLQIAFAEELYLYCHANNINFPELRDALNTKWNVNILEPREGIGGHCLPKDTKMFLQSSESISKILTAATEVDQDYRRYRSGLNERLQSLQQGQNSNI